MFTQDRILNLIGIPHAAILSVVFGLFLASFPIGAHVVFSSDIGNTINYNLPLTHLDLFEGTQVHRLPVDITLGDAFVIIWALYVILFAVATLGPYRRFDRTISDIMATGRPNRSANYMLGIIMWFSILVLASSIIIGIQNHFEIETRPPDVENDLVMFFYITLAPIIEETGFRLLLVGIPVFLIYAGRFSPGYFLRCLWRPDTLGTTTQKRALVVIVLIGVLFGFSHIALGEPWSEGKFAQATASGIILGWAYIRYGFVAAVMIHWAANYFIFAYIHFISQTRMITVDEVTDHTMIFSIEIILVVCAVLSIATLVAGRMIRSTVTT